MPLTGTPLSRETGPLLTAAAQLSPYALVQLPSSLAALVVSEVTVEVNGRVPTRIDRAVTLPKTAGYALLAGGRAYVDVSAGAVHFKRTGGEDYYAGVVAEDAAEADTTCKVVLLPQPSYTIRLREEAWTTEATDGLGVADRVGARGVELAFDAVAEVAQAALYSDQTIPIGTKWIWEARLVVVDNGDNAALDLDLGMASASHATDFESIAEFAAFHLDGATLDLDVHSDDGTTDRPIEDTTVNLVLGTAVDLWIDGRVRSDIKFYVDGVRKASGTTFTLAVAGGPLKAIAHCEKTNDDTSAKWRVIDMNVRTAA